jgi:hypothetical protein
VDKDYVSMVYKHTYGILTRIQHMYVLYICIYCTVSCLNTGTMLQKTRKNIFGDLWLLNTLLGVEIAGLDLLDRFSGPTSSLYSSGGFTKFFFLLINLNSLDFRLTVLPRVEPGYMPWQLVVQQNL